MELPETEGTPNFYLWMIDKIGKCRVPIHAGHVTFFMLVSFFPFMMFLLTLMQNLEMLHLDRVRDYVAGLNLGFIGNTIAGWIDDIISANSGILPVATLIVLIWTGSKGFDGLVQGLENIYNARKKRSFVKRRAFSILYLFSFVLILLASLVLIVFGTLLVKWITSEIPGFSGMKVIITILRYLMISVILTVYFTLLFRFLPNTPSETVEEKKQRKAYNKGVPRKQRKKRPVVRTIRKEFPGALLTAIVWIVFSRLYGMYMSYQVEHNSIYGSLTAFFLTLLWLYYCMVVTFVGGLYNCYYYENGEPALRHVFRDIPGAIKFFLSKFTNWKETRKEKKNTKEKQKKER